MRRYVAPVCKTRGMPRHGERKNYWYLEDEVAIGFSGEAKNILFNARIVVK